MTARPVVFLLAVPLLIAVVVVLPDARRQVESGARSAGRAGWFGGDR